MEWMLQYNRNNWYNDINRVYYRLDFENLDPKILFEYLFGETES